uniref:Uncharacterized protein n=1 Tax=Meloidogyne floridensis TaxID=298350 RepID=A0A915NIJ6_9BILA
MSSPTYEQMQTVMRVFASVIQELRQRFDKPTDQNDVPVQPVLKKKQKEQLLFRECRKRLGKKILVRMQQRSAPQLHNDRKQFPVEEWCDRPSSQYDCSYGCQARSASTGNVFSPSTPVSIPTMIRSASTGDLGTRTFEDSYLSSSKAQRQPTFPPPGVPLEIPHSDVDSVPSSIQSSACLLSRLEARERVCKSCRRGGPQHDCCFGCRHTKSCPGLIEYPPEMMKFIVDCEAITGHRFPTFSTKRAMEIAEECDEEEQSSKNSVGDCNRPYCCCSLLLARHYDYLIPLDTPSRDAVTADCRSAKTAASHLTSPSDDYFGQSSENFSLEPLLGSLEDITSTKTCLQPTHQRNYFLDEEWGLDFVSVGASCESMNTMEELDPEEWQLLEYSARPFALLDDFSTGSTYSDSSIRAYVRSLSPLEAREKVRKLALQASNVDDFFELIPDNLLDNFFSDYKMLVQHKMLEEQCDNIREELMKQPKKADD